MAKQYQVQVFGKAGCDKCAILNQRLDKLLEKKEWSDFEKKYYDVETEEGIISFCEAECINPQRIPAFVVARTAGESSESEALVNSRPGAIDDICGNSRLYQYVGIQTDYSEDGRGIISPKMISTVLNEALSRG